MEDSSNHLILITTLGESAPIATLTLNKLLCERGFVEKVIVIHTAAERVKQAIVELEKAWVVNNGKRTRYRLFSGTYTESERQACEKSKSGVLAALRKKLGGSYAGFVEEGEEDVLLNIELETRELQFSGADEHCVEHRGTLLSGGVEDDSCPCSAKAVQDYIHQAICEMKHEERGRVVISLTGGRKTMTAAAALAAQNLRAGLLCHISSPGQYRFLLQAPLDSYELIEQPFTDLSEVIALAGRNCLSGHTGLRGSEVLNDPRTFGEALKVINDYPEGISLVAGLTNAHDAKRLNPLVNHAWNLIETMKAQPTEELGRIEELALLFEAYERYHGLSSQINDMIVKGQYPPANYRSVYSDCSEFVEDLKTFMQIVRNEDRPIAVNIDADQLDGALGGAVLSDAVFFSIRQIFENSLKLIKAAGSFSVACADGQIHISDSGDKYDPGQIPSTESWYIGLKLVRFLLRKYNLDFDDSCRNEGKFIIRLS